jgi:hypothetical protein
MIHRKRIDPDSARWKICMACVGGVQTGSVDGSTFQIRAVSATWSGLFQLRKAQMGEMHWLNQDGVPHDFFPQLKGNVLLNEKTAETLFAGAPKTLDQVFADAKAGKPQAFALAATARIHTATNTTVAPLISPWLVKVTSSVVVLTVTI